MTTNPRPKVVQMVVGDTGRQLRLSIIDPVSKLPADFSAGGASVQATLKAVGGTTLKATLTCSKLAGIVKSDGTINSSPPYNVPGSGGRCQVDWTSESVDTAGRYTLEVRITFDTGKPLTLRKLLHIDIRNRQ